MLTTRRKPIYPIGAELREYLARYGREVKLPITYAELRHFRESMPLVDKDEKDTLWHTVLYYSFEMQRIHDGLKEIYALLKCGGERSVMEHLYVDRIDFCSFGNSEPFRIRIVNSLNDNQDYYYVKKADASRIYGLELEHLLSPNRMHFLTCEETLIEEHVAGIPGDVFIKDWLHNPQVKIVRLAKELVKFNERCFVRLLGDMRSCNFAMDMTPDVEEVQIRIRPTDFDQQSYNERKNFYLPQFFKENRELVAYCLRHLNATTARQYQREEQSLILRRMHLGAGRLRTLLDVMAVEQLSFPEKVAHLRADLAIHYKDERLNRCETMGALVRHNLETLNERRHKAGL
ncbi:MAG: hypothetical protein QOD99_3133 [Chthoniobacter sp.]|nr:hypothetical protein [Chthoniobacter sp.]